MKPEFLDTHPLSPVQSAKKSQWAHSSRSGIRYVETEAACFRIREGGSGGPTVVFIADGPNTIEHHDPIFDRIAQWTRVIAIDPPGFGFSTPNPGFDFNVSAFAYAFVQLLSVIGPGPYVLCATCSNVYPAVVVAGRHPELISHLVLMQAVDWPEGRAWVRKVIDPAGDLATPYAGQDLMYRTRPAVAKIWYPLAVGQPDRVDGFLRQACECMSHNGNFCLASLIQCSFGPDVKPLEFPPVTQPALAIWGLADRSHRKSDKRSLLKLAPHAQYVEREGVGHFPEIEDPIWFEELLKRFLSD